MNQLLAIRAFARVVETGSFTRAADSLHMPKTSVSKLVDELETHLGVKLLTRTTRRVAVTSEGSMYYGQTERLVRELEDIDTSLAGSHKQPQGIVRVTLGSSLASCVVLPALPAFLDRHPGIQVELDVTDRHVDLVAENVDCAIRGGRMTDETVVARLLGMASWRTCAAPGYLARFGEPTDPADLQARHRLVNYQSARTSRVLPASFEQSGARFKLEGPASVSVNESNANLAAGLAGLGVIQNFNYVVRPYLDSGALVEVLPDWRPPPYPIHVVYPPNRHMGHRIRVFIDWLAEEFARLA
ncbi:LysR family transcriptional regulator [Lysobacter solisilvae (ex Woo and Kim 2020)]|uniref:LysR family transcriptional regulator n=1 Tax=Agrilutibacter terrestris TaxID=2865112 RepID=A0A7H0FX25_9GAMM|nr:LysR family transcriptional regulator [Lysobacter terrestris]QNP40591.1 LysR family transcriptional regulator [Lysobacter terrestris]